MFGLQRLSKVFTCFFSCNVVWYQTILGFFGYLIWDMLWGQFVLDWVDKATKTNRKAEIYKFFKMVFEKTLSFFSKLSRGTQCSSYLLENSFIQILNLQFISSNVFFGEPSGEGSSYAIQFISLFLFQSNTSTLSTVCFN